MSETLPNTVYGLLLGDFPESLVTTLFVFSLLKFRLRDKRVLLVAVLQTFTNLVRQLPIAFGTHSLILVFSLAIYVRLITKAKLTRIFLAVLTCFALFVAAELSYSKPLLGFFDLDYQQGFDNPFIRALFALPSELLLLLLSIGINRYNRKKGTFQSE